MCVCVCVLVCIGPVLKGIKEERREKNIEIESGRHIKRRRRGERRAREVQGKEKGTVHEVGIHNSIENLERGKKREE